MAAQLFQPDPATGRAGGNVDRLAGQSNLAVASRQPCHPYCGWRDPPGGPHRQSRRQVFPGAAPMTLIKQSWSAFSHDIAKIYLDGFGHPSEHSKALSAAVLREIFGDAEFRLADFGCGNGHLFDYYKASGLSLQYGGYDFSSSLLVAGRERFQGNQSVRFVEADIEDQNLSGEQYDVVLFSHVLEMLQSPQRGLLAARRLAPMVMIRFFEPPTGDYDIAEIRQLDIGSTQSVPYLRRTMSRGYYNLLLDAVGCRSVDVHQAEGDKDQIHVLRF